MYVRQNLQQLVVKKAQGNFSAFARLCGVEDASIRQWVSGKSLPSLEKAAQVAEACGVTLDWLVNGPHQKGSSSRVEDDFVFVPRLAIAPSAGHGSSAAGVDQDATDLLAFRREWLHRIGLHASRAHALSVRGDSMEPTIPDGSIVLVDRDACEYQGEGIYVVSILDDIVVKRLQREIDGTFILRSDNELYRDQAIPPETDGFKIEGRVRWFGRMA